MVYVVLFDNDCSVLYDRVPISEVPVMTDREYFTRGCTALLDALGGAIHHIGNVHKYAREEDVPEHTVFVITTDGLENASRKFTYGKVRSMVEAKKQAGWEFIFLGANIDAVKEARRYGIMEDKAVTYVNDREGNAAVYDSMQAAVTSARKLGRAIPGWKQAVEDDVKRRK